MVFACLQSSLCRNDQGKATAPFAESDLPMLRVLLFGVFVVGDCLCQRNYWSRCLSCFTTMRSFSHFVSLDEVSSGGPAGAEREARMR